MFTGVGLGLEACWSSFGFQACLTGLWLNIAKSPKTKRKKSEPFSQRAVNSYMKVMLYCWYYSVGTILQLYCYTVVPLCDIC